MGSTSKMGIPYPAATDYVSDGATDMQALAEEVDDKTGLVLVHSQSFSGADPLDITSVFTSDYRNYKVLLSHYGSSATTADLQFFSGTNTIFNSANYDRLGLTFNTSNIVGGAYAASQTNFRFAAHSTTAANLAVTEMTIYSPQVASTRTFIQMRGIDATSDSVYIFDCVVKNTTQFTGIRIDATTGTLTGNIQIYGFNQ